MKNVHKLTEGAILLAVATVILLISIYVPIIGSLLIFGLPLPFIMFSSKNSLKNIAAFLIASIFLSFITGSIIGLALMLMFGTAGVVKGYLLQKNKSRTFILIASSLFFMAGMVIYYIVLAFFMKINIIHELNVVLNEFLKSYQDMLKSMGKENQIKQLKDQGANLVRILAPSILIMSSIFISFITQWVCFPIAKRFGANIQPWGSFRNFSLPKSLLLYYLIDLGAMILIHPKEDTYLYAVLINGRSILDLLIFIQGCAILFYFLHYKSISKGLGVLVTILAFANPTIHYIMILLGITDLGFDLRKRLEKKE